MRYIVTLGLVLLGAYAYAQTEPTFKLKPVVTVEDAKACGEAGGRGAFVFPLDAEGNVVGEQEPYCVLAVK